MPLEQHTLEPAATLKGSFRYVLGSIVRQREWLARDAGDDAVGKWPWRSAYEILGDTLAQLERDASATGSTADPHTGSADARFGFRDLERTVEERVSRSARDVRSEARWLRDSVSLWESHSSL